MLIEFSVANFRSIRDRQTLSMVAAPRLKRKENTITPRLRGEKLPALLKVVAIYGPNASGKSTLILAIGIISNLMKRTPTAEKGKLPVSSFRFDPMLRDKPSEFEIHFISNEIRYSYELALDSVRIHKERLTSYPKGVATLLYLREFKSERDEYKFGDDLEGGAELHEAWRKLTGPQVLFINQAVANSNEELTQLKAPFTWLEKLMVVKSGMNGLPSLVQRLVIDAPSLGDQITGLLQDVDIPILSIHSKIEDSSAKQLTLPPEIAARVPDDAFKKSAVLSTSNISTTLVHKTALGEAAFDFEEESDGTKNMIGFSLPWYIFRSNQGPIDGRLLVVDELDSSLHPKLVEALVKMHLSSGLDCQIIFTTHDTHLMDTKLLRRDQIWVTERNADGATMLRSIYDFEGREGEDIEKRYFEGRYRALPLVRSR